MTTDWYQIIHIVGQFLLVFGIVGQIAEIVNHFDPRKLDKPLHSYFKPDYE